MDRGSAGKRGRSQIGSDYDRTGDNKRRNASGQRDTKAFLEDTIYRILCPGSKIGSVIGKGGEIIQSLREETRAKIKIADSIPGVDDRVIIISSKDRRSHDADHEETVNGKECVCPAQNALFKIFSRIMEDEGVLTDAEEDDENKAMIRLLVPSSQVGCVIGKEGKFIEQIRSETGAQIRVSRDGKLPACAMSNDALLQIRGPPKSVKRALYEVSSRLDEFPPKDSERMQLSNSFSTVAQNPYLNSVGHIFPSGAMLPPGGASIVGMGSQYSAVTGATWPLGSNLTAIGSRTGRRDDSEAIEFSIQMLCKKEKIGGVIGKCGRVIKQLRNESGANIKVEDQVPNCDERVIVISCNERADDTTSPTLDAVLKLQVLANESGEDEMENEVTTRLLVPTNQIGCILGKGGSIITELRKKTRAAIRIMSKDDLPECASQDVELVQIVGEIQVARDALIQITRKLRTNVFKDKDGGAMAGLVVPSLFGSSAYGGAHLVGSMYSLSGLDLQGPTSGRYSTASYGTYGALNDASGIYGPPTSYVAGLGASGGPGFAVSRNKGGTSIELTIPKAMVGSIVGRGGSNINRIREISGAKVILHDAERSSSNRIVEISGTPDQTHAAHSLIEAYAANGGSIPTGRGY